MNEFEYARERGGSAEEYISSKEQRSTNMKNIYRLLLIGSFCDSSYDDQVDV